MTRAPENPLGIEVSAIIIWLCAVAPIGSMLMPLLIPQIQQAFSMGPKVVGLLASVDFAGTCIATITAPIWLRWLRERTAVFIGLGLVILGNAMTAWAGHPELVLCGRLLAGLGSGAIFGGIIPLLSVARNPARLLSGVQLAQLLMSGLALLGAPWLMAAQGPKSIYFAMMGLASASILAALRISAVRRPHSDTVLPPWAAIRPAFGAIFAILVYFIAVGALSVFMGKVGVQHSLPLAGIGAAIAIGNIGGIPGSLLVAWLAKASYRTGLLVAATVVEIAAIALLLLVHDLMAFTVAGFLITLATTVIGPVQVGVLVKVDSSGRAIEGLAAIQSVGQAVGPLVAGLFITASRVDGAYLFGAVCCAVSLLAIFWRGQGGMAATASPQP
jgi:MFS family permease